MDICTNCHNKGIISQGVVCPNCNGEAQYWMGYGGKITLIAVYADHNKTLVRFFRDSGWMSHLYKLDESRAERLDKILHSDLVSLSEYVIDAHGWITLRFVPQVKEVISMESVEQVRYMIGENLSSLWAMRRAWEYWKRYILTTDSYLKMRKGTKKRLAAERKARFYYMHFCRMFLTYGTNPVQTSHMLARMNSARLDLGLHLSSLSELVDRPYHLSEIF